MINSQILSEQIAKISDFMGRYKKALEFNNLKLQKKTDSTTRKMFGLYSNVVKIITPLNDFAHAELGPRSTIMVDLLRNTKDISCILPYKHMSLNSVISELKSLTNSDWACSKKRITLTDHHDGSKHELIGYFLLKGVSQQEAESTSVKININDIKWGEAIPVSNIVLHERVRENYLANSKFDLFYNTDKDNVLKYHSTISAREMKRNYLTNCIDLSYAFNNSDIPKVHPVALDNLVYDNRNCNFSDYKNAIINVLAKFLAHQPELVLDRLNKKIEFLKTQPTNSNEEEINEFENNNEK